MYLYIFIYICHDLLIFATTHPVAWAAYLRFTRHVCGVCIYIDSYVCYHTFTYATTHPHVWAAYLRFTRHVFGACIYIYSHICHDWCHDSSCCVGCLSEVHPLVVSLRYVCIDAHMCINMNISVQICLYI